MLLAILYGLIIGSFLNVCIYRIPRGESIAFPPSHCTTCNSQLKSRDLVPVISYVLYKGKCRYCGDMISRQYPFVELLNAILYFILYTKFGLTLSFLQYAILASLLIIITFIDYQLQIIPDELIIFGLISGIVFFLFTDFKVLLLQGFIGLIVGGGIFLLIALITNGAMGGGDIKLMGMLGLWFGWKYILIITLLSFVIGAVISILLMTLKIKNRKDAIPFGPFISIAAFIMIYCGKEIIQWYMIHIIY